MNELAIVGLEWLGALTIFLVFIVFLRYLDHRERMAMIKHGIVPPTRYERVRTLRGSAMLRGGLITAMVGVAVTLGLYTMGYLLPMPFSAVPGRFGPWLLPGLIPTAVGLALIASYYLSPPRSEPEDGSPSEKNDVAEKGQDGVGRQGWHLLDKTRKDPADHDADAADA